VIPLLCMMIEDEDNAIFIERLYGSYVRLMYDVISDYTTLISAKFDIVQDTLVKLYPHLDYLKTLDHDQLANYIIKTTKSAVVDYIRNEKRQGGAAYIENLDTKKDESAELDARLMAIEETDAFQAAWRELDEDTQRLLLMKLNLRMPDKEIAEALGLTTTSVHVLVYRARKKFIRIFSSQNP